jgi:hypothetical protein
MISSSNLGSFSSQEEAAPIRKFEKLQKMNNHVKITVIAKTMFYLQLNSTYSL